VQGGVGEWKRMEPSSFASGHEDACCIVVHVLVPTSAMPFTFLAPRIWWKPGVDMHSCHMLAVNDNAEQPGSGHEMLNP
jgi:hypothetical protein